MSHWILPVLLLFSAVIPCLAETALPKVGVLMPFTGEVAVIGEKTRKGYELAEAQFADRVKIVYEDIGSMAPAAAVRAASKLIDVDKVSAIVGPYGPEQTVPVAPLAARAHIPLLSFTLCSTQFEKMANVYCAYPSIAVQLESMVPLSKEKKLRSLAVISEESSYGRETTDALSDILSRNSIDLVLREFVSPQERDVRTLAAKLRTKKPDGVFVIFGNPTQAFAVLRQLWDSGYRGERFAFIDYDDKYLGEFGEFTEGIYVPGAFTGKFSDEYLELHRQRYKEEPDLYSAEAFDLLMSALRALEHNGWSAVGFEQAISKIGYNRTAIPGFRFATDRTVSFPMGLLVARAGHFVPAQ